MSSSRNRHIALWLLGFALCTLYHLIGFSGMRGFDDIEYAFHANEVLKGTLNLEDHHFAYRWTVIYPAALFYHLFGIGDFASGLGSALAAALMLLTVIRLTRGMSFSIQLLAVLLTVLVPNYLYFADKLMPDIQVALGGILAIGSHAEGKQKKNQAPIWGTLMACGAFWALLSKATVILLLPIFLYLLINDIKQRENRTFWSYAFGSGIIMLLAYLLVIYLATGNPFTRYERIVAKGYLNTCSYDQLPIKFLLQRISYEWILAAAQSGGLMAFLPVFVSIFIRTETSPTEKGFQYWRAVGWAGFLSANFMTISPTAYIPMCVDERHFMWLIPLWGIAGASCSWEIWKHPRLSSLVSLLCLILLLINGGVVQWAYALMGLAFLLPFLKKMNGYKIGISLFVFVPALLIIPIQNAFYFRSLHYQDHKAVLSSFEQEQKGPTLIITDAVQERIGNYLNGMDSSYHIQYREFGTAEASWLERNPQTYYLSNAYSRFMSGMEWQDLPAYAREIPEKLSAIVDTGHLELFHLPDISWVMMPVPFWQDSIDRGTPAHEGAHLDSAIVAQPKTFVEAWEIPFSEIPYAEGQLWIRAELYIRKMDDGQGNWQIHVDDIAGNNHQWKSAALKHRTPVPLKWVKLQIDHLVDIPKDSTQLLKMRFWNDGPALFEIASIKCRMAWVKP
ncbi:MAG: glycosyltransferase family 39 protein [Bacteroidota bacterium]